MKNVMLGRKGVNFGNSLTAAGVRYVSSKDEDVVKYFGKKIVFPYAQLDLKFAVKVDFSCGGCQKLPNRVKITDQNADLLQLVRQIFYSKS